MIYRNVLELIGNTPIVKLNKVSEGIPGNFFVKLEFYNPGGSVKDRIGWYLIEDAEKRGLLKPGGTIVEATSGNTGIGLAIAAAIKGYQTVFVLPDKMTKEKITLLQSFGAQVVITPTAVEPTDPRSHYSTARKIAAETPNSYLTSQYDNLANRESHYLKTGPEILNQMPEIDVLIAGMGTGGTLCGTGKYLKEKKPNVKLICADPYGSIIYDMFKHGKVITPPASYQVEGIGEDIIPKNFDLTLLDDVVQMDDQTAFKFSRELLHKEGLFVGTSSGTAVAAAFKWAKQNPEWSKGKNFLIIIPDNGSKYMSKTWSDEWMTDKGFMQGDLKALKSIQYVEGAIRK